MKHLFVSMATIDNATDIRDHRTRRTTFSVASIIARMRTANHVEKRIFDVGDLIVSVIEKIVGEEAVPICEQLVHFVQRFFAAQDVNVDLCNLPHERLQHAHERARLGGPRLAAAERNKRPVAPSPRIGRIKSGEEDAGECH